MVCAGGDYAPTPSVFSSLSNRISALFQYLKVFNAACFAESFSKILPVEMYPSWHGVSVSCALLCSYRLRPRERPRPCTQPPPLSWRDSAACTCTMVRGRSPQPTPTISCCRKSCGPRAVPWWVFRKPEEHLSFWVNICRKFDFCTLSHTWCILCDSGRRYYITSSFISINRSIDQLIKEILQIQEVEEF